MIRVLIVDDSKLKQNFIISVLNECPVIDVVGTASNGKQAIERCRQLKPDVITMDINMPVMGGLEAIDHIMRNCPTVIIAVTEADDEIIRECLNCGVVDFFSLNGPYQQKTSELIGKIITASKVKVIRRICPIDKGKTLSKDIAGISHNNDSSFNLTSVIVIGASTGGPYALEKILSVLEPEKLKAGILIVQHMSSGFIHGLTKWLNSKSGFQVSIASDGDKLENGKVFLAPEQHVMEIDRDGKIVLKEDKNNDYLFVPSIDALMISAAKSFGSKVIGVIMTGMGYDGVEGMKTIKKFGGITIAQDEKTSVVFGMNRAAIEENVIDRILGVDEIGPALTLN